MSLLAIFIILFRINDGVLCFVSVTTVYVFRAKRRTSRQFPGSCPGCTPVFCLLRKAASEMPI